MQATNRRRPREVEVLRAPAGGSLAALGMRYFAPGMTGKLTSDESDPYYFEVFAGAHSVAVARGDCAFWLSKDATTMHLTRGPATIASPTFATMIRGFAPENKSSTVLHRTVLPYTNGCSTKQIFPADRPGDPTLQMLLIPPNTTEQVHHIHSTVRCVYVLSGRGRSILGMHGEEQVDLVPGMICVLERMAPHHFDTAGESLVVLPVHVWSSIRGAEQDHPMVHGTFRV